MSSTVGDRLHPLRFALWIEHHRGDVGRSCADLNLDRDFYGTLHPLSIAEKVPGLRSRFRDSDFPGSNVGLWPLA